MKQYSELGKKFLNSSNADALAIAVINFKTGNYEFLEFFEEEIKQENSQVYFDLASLTKPLTNSFYAIRNDVQDKRMLDVLNHCAGIPAWGLLGANWKDQILSYTIQKSNTTYSDFSALRFMLEMGDGFKEKVFQNLDSDIYFWKDLPNNKKTVQNGFINGKANFRAVHDPNAFNINSFTSHAGLFGTVEGLVRTLVNFNDETDFIKKVKNSIDMDRRFVLGFDRVQDPKTSLAGSGCSDSTFGHLGFTGTSFWIDSKSMVGHVILSNSTKYFWFDKKELNIFRREFGSDVWKTVLNRQ